MPNNYVAQPIAIHEVKALQHFRRGSCGYYENTYLRTGTALALPNILIRRLTSGASFGVNLYRAEDDVNMGAMTDPGFANNQLDDPINAYEMATFDRGDWTLPSEVADGYYYLKFISGFFSWYSDEIHIVEGVSGWPPDCDGFNYVKLRWRQPMCTYSGVSIGEDGERVDILAYPEGMDFFCFLKGGALVESEWEPDIIEGPATGSGAKNIERRRSEKRWNLQGAPVSEAIIDAMQSSAFFDFVELYFPLHTDPYFEGTDIVVEATSEDKGCTYVFSYKFTAGFLLKQGCCP